MDHARARRAQAGEEARLTQSERSALQAGGAPAGGGRDSEDRDLAGGHAGSIINPLPAALSRALSMNIKLAFTPVSQAAVDLLVFVLDDEQVLHEVDDPAIRAHVQRAAGQYREKTLKREYFATLPEGSAASALVIYWSPSLKAWNLWENVKTFTARALRLARDYRHVRIGIVMNSAAAAPLIGKVAEGAIV